MPSRLTLGSVLIAALALSGEVMSKATRTCKKHKERTATFDTVQFTQSDNYYELDPVYEYRGLNYTNFVGYNNTNTTYGVQPHSGSNEIAFLPYENSGDSTIAAIKTYGNMTFFDFKSLYFGCSTNDYYFEYNDGLQEQPAVGCILTASGFYKGKELITQEFTYDPNVTKTIHTEKKAAVKAAKFHSGFTGIDRMEFTIQNLKNTENNYYGDITLFMDDITYTPWFCTKK